MQQGITARPRALRCSRQAVREGAPGAAPYRDTLRLPLVFAHNRTGTVTYVCNLYGLTEGQVCVADDTADDVEMVHTRRVIEGIDHLPSRTAVSE